MNRIFRVFIFYPAKPFVLIKNRSISLSSCDTCPNVTQAFLFLFFLFPVIFLLNRIASRAWRNNLFHVLSCAFITYQDKIQKEALVRIAMVDDIKRVSIQMDLSFLEIRGL